MEEVTNMVRTILWLRGSLILFYAICGQGGEGVCLCDTVCREHSQKRFVPFVVKGVTVCREHSNGGSHHYGLYHLWSKG